MTGELDRIDGTQPEDPLVGTVFADRFEIIELIGQGGMGLVYKARHKVMGRNVAIKIVRSQQCNELTVQRFKREAKAVSALDHPNIVTVFDYGVSPQGAPFLVMDYLHGTSLSALVRAADRLSVPRMMRIFKQCCRALNHAHRKGIIHRDLNTRNVMLVEHDGNPDVVKIVDFGMAKLLPSEQWDEESKELTQAGDVFGSPLFMSPEQCQGKPLDVRSDIYSLACIMYYAVTGLPVVVGDNVLETIQRQISDEPAHPSTLVNDGSIPANLDAILMKALRKNPDDRYQTMEALLDDLIALEAGSDRISATAPIKRPAKPRKQGLSWQFGSSIAACICLSALAAFTFGQMFENLNEAHEASTWMDFNRMAQKAYRKGNLKQAERAHRMALEEALRFSPNDPRTARSYCSLGMVHIAQDKLPDAEHELKEAIKIFEQCYGVDSSEVAQPLLALSRVYQAAGQEDKATRAHDKAVHILEQAFGENSDVVTANFERKLPKMPHGQAKPDK